MNPLPTSGLLDASAGLLLLLRFEASAVPVEPSPGSGAPKAQTPEKSPCSIFQSYSASRMACPSLPACTRAQAASRRLRTATDSPPFTPASPLDTRASSNCSLLAKASPPDSQNAASSPTSYCSTLCCPAGVSSSCPTSSAANFLPARSHISASTRSEAPYARSFYLIR